MKTVCWILIISIFLWSACSSIHFNDHEQSDYYELNKKIAGKKGTITLVSGQKIEVKNIFFVPDSVSWIESELRIRQTVPTSEIQEIIIKDRGKGAIRGLWMGFLGGLIGSLLFQLAPLRECSSCEPGIVKTFILMVGGPAGGLLGLSFGAAICVTDKFILNDIKKEADDIKEVPVGIIIISDRVGEVIDRQERDKYNLFPLGEGLKFQSTVFYRQSNGEYIMEITYLDEKSGEQKTEQTHITESMIKTYQNQINKLEPSEVVPDKKPDK